ncbi:DUF6087 family protein [Streptomyces nojiriensis]
MTEEPFEEWAVNLLARRAARVGMLRASLIDGSAGRGAHVNPTAPRLMARWDVYRWVPETVAADYAAAQRMLHGIGSAQAEPAPPLLGRSCRGQPAVTASRQPRSWP